MTDLLDEAGWTDGDSEAFIHYGTYFVPERERQIETVSRLAAARADADAHFADIGCGEGLLAESLLARLPKATVYALDGSEAMLDHARARLSEYEGRVHFGIIDVADDSWWRFPHALSAVVSSLTLHHLLDDEKRHFYAGMWNVLKPGGALIMADLIRPNSRAAWELAGAEWDVATKDRSLALHGDLEPFERFVEWTWNLFTDPDPPTTERPSTVLDHLRWLEEVGFEGADVFWLSAGHAIFGGWRSPSER
jgi:tRNA (cmo5U34)-methyltransferase